MRLIAATVLLLLSSAAYSDNSPNWSFFSAQQSYRADWEISRGVADIGISSGRISIKIYEIITTLPDNKQALSPEITESIDGTIDEQGKIRGIHLIHNSDADEMPVSGHYYRHEAKERWGNDNVSVIYESIIFEDGKHVFGFARKSKK